MNNIYGRAMYAYGEAKLPYALALEYNYQHALLCDDYTGHPRMTNIGDWSFYVR